ncbi:MAG: transcriptional regulator [Alphaproteobacteria bacterium]|nr:transcriptional regulator [Alphaproteobacteria bacterium]
MQRKTARGFQGWKMSEFFSSFSLENLLIAFVLLWVLQGVGVWFQSRRYIGEMKTLQDGASEGYLGAGHSRQRFGAGSIVMLVTDASLKVTKFKLMRGLTIFARFADRPDFVGLDLAELQARLEQEPKKSSLRIAGISAINQILRVKRDREQPDTSAAPGMTPA